MPCSYVTSSPVMGHNVPMFDPPSKHKLTWWKSRTYLMPPKLIWREGCVGVIFRQSYYCAEGIYSQATLNKEWNVLLQHYLWEVICWTWPHVWAVNSWMLVPINAVYRSSTGSGKAWQCCLAKPAILFRHHPCIIFFFCDWRNSCFSSAEDVSLLQQTTWLKEMYSITSSTTSISQLELYGGGW